MALTTTLGTVISKDGSALQLNSHDHRCELTELWNRFAYQPINTLSTLQCRILSDFARRHPDVTTKANQRRKLSQSTANQAHPQRSKWFDFVLKVLTKTSVTSICVQALNERHAENIARKRLANVVGVEVLSVSKSEEGPDEGAQL